MKKTLFLCFFATIAFNLFADVELRFLGNYSIPSESLYDSKIGGTLGIEWSPISLRGRDNIFATVSASYDAIGADGIEDVAIWGGELGLGYNFRFLDRLSISLEGFTGLWSVSKDEKQNFDSASGIVWGGRGSVNFHILPELTASVFAGYKYFDCNPDPITKNTQFGIGLKYNFSKGIFKEALVRVEDASQVKAEPIFPVFYSRYADNSFATVSFVNSEANDIKDVEVSVFVEKFMSNPYIAKKIDRVKRGEVFDVDLKAFFNEGILSNLSATSGYAKVTVSYSSLGKRMQSVHNVELVILGRNAMTWADDSAAAAFVSPKDATAYKFARLVYNAVCEEFVSGKSENIQFAASISGALKEYGLNYVIDPNSAFVDNVDSASIDFLQFPYQTLLYHGGDCDDLSILNCAIFESMGIDSALITVPAHIYMAFDSGVSVNEAGKIAGGQYIVQDGKVWIPLEITMCQDSFAAQWQMGYREWTGNPKDRMLIPLKDAWKSFKQVGISDSDVKIEMPTKNKILKAFRNNN